MFFPNHLIPNPKATEAAGSLSHGTVKEDLYNHRFFPMYRSTPFSCQAKNRALAIFQALEVSPAADDRNLKRFKFLLIIQSTVV